MSQSAIAQEFDDGHYLGRLSDFSDGSDSLSNFSSFISPRPFENSDNTKKTPTYSWSRRLADDPSASMLDLDEDVRSSVLTSEVGEDEEDRRLEGDSDELSRVSYLGPKMRFHSRAPWEMEDDPLDEDDETGTTQSHFASIFSGSRSKGRRKSNSSSPRPSNVSRPSVDSRSEQVVPKRSFETSASHSVSHPRGALYALAQESLSTSSLSPSLSPSVTRPSHSGRQESTRGKFSLGLLRANSPNVSSQDASTVRFPLSNRTPSSSGDANASSSPHESYASSALDRPAPNSRYADRLRSPSYADGTVHPYANPDLVISYVAEPALESPLRTPVERQAFLGQVLQNDLNDTATVHATAPITSPEPSSSDTSTKGRISHVQGKDISSPIHFQSALPRTEPQSLGQPSDARGSEPAASILGPFIPGWTGRVGSPGFSLISLEEARAQRAKNVIASGNGGGNVVVSMDLGSGSRSSGSGSAGDSMQSTTLETNNTTSANPVLESDRPQSPYHHASSRSRTRSGNASAKAKNALQTFVGVQNPPRKDSDPFPISGVNSPPQSQWLISGKDAERDKERQKDTDSASITTNGGGPGTVPGKSLKHKKSGFMRLFSNSGKDKDKEVPPLPPPVPPLPDNSSEYAISRVNAKHALHRIPVPSLSPSLLEAIAAQEHGNTAERQSTSERGNESSTNGTVTATLKSVLGPKRTPPPALSINTTTKGTTISSTGSAPNHNGVRSDGNNSAGPQSAPAQVSDFPALKLRPISTLFSAEFSDLIKSDLNQDNEYKGGEDKPSSNGDAGRRRMEQQKKFHQRQGTLATIASAPAFTLGSSGPSTASFSDFGFAMPSSPVTSVSTGLTTPVTSAGPGLVSPVSSGATWNWTAVGQQQHIVSSVVGNGVIDASMVKELQEQFESSKQAWQRRILELEGQVRDLKSEVEEWKNRCAADGTDGSSGGYCETCGRGKISTGDGMQTKPSIMRRPRARTGASSRFINSQLS